MFRSARHTLCVIKFQIENICVIELSFEMVVKLFSNTHHRIQKLRSGCTFLKGFDIFYERGTLHDMKFQIETLSLRRRCFEKLVLLF